jgi:hypothetical protein
LSQVYDVGDSARLSFTVTIDGTPTDATVSVTVTKPDGSTVVVSGGSLTHTTGTGVYATVLATDQAGLWAYRWTATGAATTAEDGSFIVEPLLGATLYATVDELRDHLGDSGRNALDGDQLERACRASSRAVDRWCHRRFWQDPTPVARTFWTTNPWRATLPDLATTTGLLVKTDTAGDGTYATTWTITTDFRVEPRDAPADGGGYAYDELQAVGGKTFPTLGPPSARFPGLQVTGRWGWSQVPDQVREATLLRAAALWRRKDAPFGVATFDQFGPVRITRADPDVVDLLGPFRRLLVA